MRVAFLVVLVCLAVGAPVSGQGDSEPCDSAVARNPIATPIGTPPLLTNRIGADRAIERASAEHVGISPGATVRVWFLIDRTGSVDAARVAETGGSASADSAALQAAREFQFDPARYRGDPVCVWIRLPVRFPDPQGLQGAQGNYRRSGPPQSEPDVFRVLPGPSG